MWCPCDHKPTYTSAKFPPLVLGSRNTSRFCNHIPSLQIDWYFRTISNPSPWSIPVWCVFLLISCEHFSCSKFSAMMLAFPECTGYRSVLHANLNTYDSCSQESMCTSCVDNCMIMTSAVQSEQSQSCTEKLNDICNAGFTDLYTKRRYTDRTIPGLNW